LKQSEEKYRTIIENIEEGYYEVDLKGNLVFCNEPLCRMFGRTKEELIGVGYRELCDEATAKELNAVFSDVYKTNTPRASITFTIIRKDGSPRTVEASVAIVRNMEQKATGFRGICRDVTEKKYTEELLLRSERLKAVGELASGVAHNFNNLLQIVMGGAQLAKANLQAGNLKAAAERLDQLFHSARLGSETVRRLQTFARLKSDFAREGHVFDLSETVRSAVEMSNVWWKSGPEKNGIHIELDESLEDGCTVFGRENELFEVVVNLVKNAVEAMPEGGKISVATRSSENEVCLIIQDTGVGIPPQHLKRIFEPFFTTGGLQRTGMGLASTYGIISEHCGEITVQSQVGKGTTFTIRLPRTVEAQTAAQAIDPDPQLRNLTFLIVDDMEYVVNLLAEGLAPFSRKVFGAYSGEQALKLFRESPTDIVLCDLGMPRMSGWEVGKRIREYCEEQGLKKPFFVVLTGWGGQDEEAQKIADSGVDAVIEKPVDINKLVQLIYEYMGKAKA
ncbi:MAG: ATP-binding protein, partial [Desulfomonilaceae bacterium]